MEDYNRQIHIDQFGSEKLCNGTLRFFVAEVPDYLATILSTVNANQPTKAAHVAKTIKTAAKLIGASFISDTASHIEHLIQANQDDLSNDIINEITDLCSAILESNRHLQGIAKEYLDAKEPPAK